MGSAKGLAIASLVFGILSVLFLGGGLIFPALAIVFGSIAKSQNKSAPEEGVKGMATAGIVLGIITLVMVVVLLAALLTFGVFVAKKAGPDVLKSLQSCTADTNSGITCISPAVPNNATKTLTLPLLNSWGSSIKIESVTSSNGNCPVVSWKTNVPAEISQDEKFNMTISCNPMTTGSYFTENFFISYLDGNNIKQGANIHVIVKN